MQTLGKKVGTIVLGFVMVFVLIQGRFFLDTRGQIVSPGMVDDSYEIGLVLGASVFNNTIPSPVLKDRLDTAIALYEEGIIDRIVVSGDNGTSEYNEVAVMSAYLLEQGIPAESIFQDFAGFDTYDSIYRAREIFQVEKMLIITQQFHLPRAVAIANDLGFETQGVIADSRAYTQLRKTRHREMGARIKAFVEIIFGSESKFSGEVISIEGASNTVQLDE